MWLGVGIRWCSLGGREGKGGVLLFSFQKLLFQDFGSTGSLRFRRRCVLLLSRAKNRIKACIFWQGGPSKCVCPPSEDSQLPPLCPPTTHLSFTHCSPPLTFAHPRLRHCTLLLFQRSVLVTLNVSCQLEVVNFRRRTSARWVGQSWLPGVQNWIQSLRHALPPTISHKVLSTALVLSISPCLPV